MTNKTKNQIDNRGYAILFAVVIVSIISLLVIGLTNSTYKALILASVARDSSTAFFQADTGTECALYAENVANMTLNSLPATWKCGVDVNDNDYNFTMSQDQVVINTTNVSEYKATNLGQDNSKSCFDFTVQKPGVVQAGDISTDIIAKGYNICDKSNPRTVERELEVKY